MGERDHFLHGAEDVRSAASTMSSAADAMRSAAGSMLDAAHAFRDANHEHEMWMSQWLDRLEAIVEKMPKTEMQMKREQAQRFAQAMKENTGPHGGGFDVT